MPTTNNRSQQAIGRFRIRAKAMLGIQSWAGPEAALLPHLKAAWRRPAPYQFEGTSVHPFLPKIANRTCDSNTFPHPLRLPLLAEYNRRIKGANSMAVSSAGSSPNQDLPRPGERIRLEPFPEPFKVYEVRPLGERIVLGIISTKSSQAQTLVLTPQELAQRLKRSPTLEEAFRSHADGCLTMGGRTQWGRK